MTQTTDATKCPLCGKENNCLNVKCGGDPENNCWCNNPDIRFPPGLTEQVPETNRGKACICEACVKAYNVKKA